MKFKHSNLTVVDADVLADALTRLRALGEKDTVTELIKNSQSMNDYNKECQKEVADRLAILHDSLTRGLKT